MASTYIKNKLLEDIEKAGGWDAVWDQIASGITQTKIAESFGVSQGFFSRVQNLEPERRAAFKEALKGAALARADKALRVAEDVPAARDEIQRARLQTDVLKWHAGSFDREQFADSPPQVNVGVNVAQMSLDALRAPLGLQEAELQKLPPSMVCLDHKLVRPCQRCDPVERERVRQGLVEAGLIWDRPHDRPQLPAPQAVEVDVTPTEEPAGGEHGGNAA
jgi:hypothetical protein